MNSQSYTARLWIILIGFSVPGAQGATWSFDIATTGQDVFWTSPTAVSNNAAEYDVTYNITNVYTTVRYLFFTTTVEVTDEIPPEYLTNSQTLAGPPPLGLPPVAFVFPPPPEPIAIAATVEVNLDAAGFGHLNITNVDFGTYDLNLPPFGTVTVTILGIRTVGSVTVTPIFAGDIDRDGDVDLADLTGFLASFGTCGGEANYNFRADFDVSGCVELGDLTVLLSNFGRS